MRRSQHADTGLIRPQRPSGRGFIHAGRQQAHHRAAAAGNLISQPLAHFHTVGACFARPDHRDHRQQVDRWEHAFHIKDGGRHRDLAKPLRKLRRIIREGGNLLLLAVFQDLIRPRQRAGFQELRLLGRNAPFLPKAAFLRMKCRFRALKHPHHRGACLRTDIQL